MAVKSAGRNFRVLVGVNGKLTPIPGERSTAGRLTNDEADTTTKNDSPWSARSPFGVRSTAIALSGVVFDQADNALFSALMTAAINGIPMEAKITSETGDWIQSRYLVTSMSRAGEYNGAEMFDISLSRYAEIETPPPTPPVEIGLAYAMDRFSDGIDGDLLRPSLYRQFNSWSAS